MKLATFCSVIAWLAISFAQALHAADITTADALLHAMHDRYNSTWYDTLTFAQKSTTYNSDGTTKVETWYEAALLPGKLRIDIGPPADGRAYLLNDGTATLFREGQRAALAPAREPFAGARF